MSTYVDACSCTWGLNDHRKRVCNGSRLWENNPLRHTVIEPVLVMRLDFQSDALLSELSSSKKAQNAISG